MMLNEQNYLEIIKLLVTQLQESRDELNDKNDKIKECKCEIDCLKSKINALEYNNRYLNDLTIKLAKNPLKINIDNYIEANAILKNKSKTEHNIKTDYYNENSGKIGIANVNNGKFKNTKITGTINEVAQKNLVEVIITIQQLLEQLLLSYPKK